MKKKVVLRLLSLAMVASMTGTMLPANIQLVSAEESAVSEEIAEAKASLKDGINDAWTLENKVDGDSATVEDGWLHIKSATGSRNNPGTNPMMVVNPNTFNFNEDGYISFILKSNNGNTSVNDSDRVGVYLGYDTDQNGMYVGYDNGGWFWQKYTGGNGDWFQGTRETAPVKGQEVSVRIDWTADHKMTLTLDGVVVFEKEDFSSIADSLGTKIAIKAGSWGENVSDVLLKEIHYTGQEEIKTYGVTGKVTDAAGKALEGATITAGDKTVASGADGRYSLELADGTYELSVVKDGYQTVKKSVTVKGTALEVEDIKLQRVSGIEAEKLSTEDMDVFVSKTFPSVVRYEMKKGDLKGKTFYGQTSEINTIRINGVNIKLSKENVKATIEGNKATYVMTARPEHVARFSREGFKAHNANKEVLSGIEVVAHLMKTNKFYVLDSCSHFKKEIYNYVWDKSKGVPVKVNDDLLDALRYAIYSESSKKKSFERWTGKEWGNYLDKGVK